MTDPLSIATGITGLLAFAGSSLTKGYSIIQSLKGGGEEIQRLLVELSQLTGILVGLDSLNKQSWGQSTAPLASHASTLDDAVGRCRKTLQHVQSVLENLERSRKAVRAVKFHLQEPKVKSLMQELAWHRETFTLCLGFDARVKTGEMLDLQIEMSKCLARIEEERRQEREQAKVHQANLDREALFRWLVPRSDGKHSKSARLRATGTGSWIFRHTKYVSWAFGSESILWLRGIPGAGKTVLLSGIIDQLKGQLQRPEVSHQGLTYFYCVYNESDTNDATSIMTSLAAQLVRISRNPEKGPAMDLFKKCDNGTLELSLSQIINLVVGLVNGFDTCFICVDALDECNPETKAELLLAFSQVSHTTQSAKFLISTRTGEMDIVRQFGQCSTITMSSSLFKDDITTYIRWRIRTGPERLRQIESEDIIKKLIAGADGMFLWVSCQLDQLSKVSTPREVRAALNSPPTPLYNTYNRILRSISPERRSLASSALRMLAHAFEPITLDVLTEVVSIEEDCSSLSHLEKLIEPNDIFDICGSLIRISDVDGTIDLSHKSVYEYLTQERDPALLPTDFYLPKRKSSVALTQICLRYLSFRDFSESNISDLMLGSELNAHDPFERQPRPKVEHPFFDYALKHWWRHLALVQDDFQTASTGLSQFVNTESGNFFSCLRVLGSIFGTYLYPASMQFVHFSASHGLSVVLNHLLATQSDLLNLQTDDGRASLHMAIERGQLKSVEVLLANKADPNLCTYDGTCPLQIALESRNEEITELLIKHEADVNTRFPDGDTPLIVAVANSWLWLVQFLLSHNASPNLKSDDRRSPLHVAAQIGADEIIVEALLQAGAYCDDKDGINWTPLHLAAFHGYSDTCRALLQNPGSEGFFPSRGYTPLHAAVEQQHVDVITVLAKFSASVWDAKASEERQGLDQEQRPFTARDKLRMLDAQLPFTSVRTSPEMFQPSVTQMLSPLSLALSQRFMEGFNILLEEGIHYHDALSCAKDLVKKKDLGTFQQLLAKAPYPGRLLCNIWAKVESVYIVGQGYTEFGNQVLAGLTWNPEMIMDCLEELSSTAVHNFEENLFKAAVQALVDLDCPVDQKEAMLGAALLIAIHTTDVELAELLCLRGASVEANLVDIRTNLTYDAGDTLLHFAARTGDAEIVTFVMNKCPLLVHSRNMSGKTVLHVMAQEDGPTGVAEKILLFETSLSIMDSKGFTPLHIAAKGENCKRSKIAFMKELLSLGADVAAKGNIGESPLHLAAYRDNPQAIELLLQHGADPLERDNNRNTPLHVCVHGLVRRRGNWPPASFETILKYNGLTAEAQNADGMTPLQLGALEAIVDEEAGECLESILKHFPELAFLSYPPSDGALLHRATALDRIDAIQTLIQFNLDLEAKDAEGKTAIQYASDRAKKILIDRGARNLRRHRHS